MVDDPKKNARAAWDDAALDDAKSLGVTPAVAKALLAMNPALRDQGLDTMKVVRQSQDASLAKAPAQPAATQAQGAGIYDTLKRIEHDVALREKEITAKIAALENERTQLQTGACHEVSQWLVKHDPDILSPVSQNALKDFDKLLRLVGFKTANYIAKFRSKR